MRSIIFKVVILSLAIVSLWGVIGEGARQEQLPAGEGREVFATKCSACHGLEDSTSMRRTEEEWQGTVNDMAAAGAQVTANDITAIVAYLSRNFGKINVNKAAAADLESFLSLTSKDAGAIVAYRTDHGAFKTIDDLKKVPAIDVKILNEKKAWITF